MLQTLAAGLVCGFLAVVLSLSLGNLLFFGEMRDFVPVGLGMALFTTMVVAAIAAVTSPIRGVISISEEIPVVAIAGPAAAITAFMSGIAPAHDIAVTIVVAAAVATLSTGAILLILGYFRLGRLIRYVPFPVIAGFLAGTGWLILQGGLSVIAGDAIGLTSLHLLLAPGVALKCALGVAFAGLIARSPGAVADVRSSCPSLCSLLWSRTISSSPPSPFHRRFFARRGGLCRCEPVAAFGHRSCRRTSPRWIGMRSLLRP